MFLKNKVVAVTGGAGFIGSHLVDRLISEEPETILVLDNLFLGKDSNLELAKSKGQVEMQYIDVADYNQLSPIFDENGVDVVFHLAVIPLPTSFSLPEWTFEKNVQMTTSILHLQREDKFKTLIAYSSSEAYGTAQKTPMDENHPMRPRTPYAASKAASDLLIESYGLTFGMDYSIVRPFNIYGPRQNEASYAAVLPITIKRILQGKPPIIYGDGEQTRDYTYVTDAANATIEVYNNKKTRNEVINIASGTQTRIKYLIELISSEMDWTKGIKYSSPRPGDVMCHQGDIAKAQKLFGYKPLVTLEEGVPQTVKWYLNYFKTNPNRL